MSVPIRGTKQRSVVTGGGGFVGRHLVNALALRGDVVVSVDLGAKPWREGVTFIDADIRDATSMQTACRDADVVFHNASIVHTKNNRKEEVWSVNLGGTESMLAACRGAGVPKLVYVSSASAVYEGKEIGRASCRERV